MAVQIAFPRQHIVFDTVLEEFVGDIAWLWIPFILFLLLANVVTLSITLRPLRLAAEEASQIEPSSMTNRLTEGRMPNDVLALVRSVNGALDRLQIGFLAMDQFAGHLAHELRTPLAIAKARVALLPHSAARDIEADFVGMERVITQLVDRVRVGTIHYEAQDLVDLGELSSTVARFMAPMVVQAGRRLELDTPDTPVVVAGAYDYLFRALRNLIENAIRHSPPGGLVSLDVFKAGISVKDQGCGFAASRLEGDQLMTEQGDRAEGLGLGLKIVSETMIAHNGRPPSVKPG
ncbi:sensor histidine kinase (plasmid) [Rhizobium ruizarguesonis]|uniref:Sensor histidine kinase n=1 Tax=Rhizobium ruizarguesonis TaxID=2081791 RepID=A0ACD5EGR6_9HYPH